MGTRGIETEAEAPPNPALFWADRAVRIVLFLVFAAGVSSVLLIGHAPQRDRAFFEGELDAGRVTTVAYDSHGHLRWAEGTLTWYRTDFGVPTPATVQEDDPAELVWRAVEDRHRNAPGELKLREVGPNADGWLGWIAWGPLVAATACAWLATLVLLALRRPRRFGSGWFWVVMLLGSVFGPPLFLLLEPGPLWRREEWPDDHRRLGLWSGLVGVLLSTLATGAFASTG